MDVKLSTTAMEDKWFLWLLCGCALIDLVCGRLLARAGFFVAKDGLTAAVYRAVAFTGIAAFNTSVVLVYLLIGRACFLGRLGGRSGGGGGRWRFLATVSLVILALLGALRVVGGPFGPVLTMAYHGIFLLCLLAGACTLVCIPDARWWFAPAIMQFFSQVCEVLFVTLQNFPDLGAPVLLGIHHAGETFFYASLWAFLGAALAYSAARRGGMGRLFARPAVIAAAAGAVSVGALAYASLVYSPYPRQAVMFAFGLTVSWPGPVLCAASLAAAAFGLALCLLGDPERRRVGMCFFLVMACGHALGQTAYHVLRAYGIRLISEAPNRLPDPQGR